MARLLALEAPAALALRDGSDARAAVLLARHGRPAEGWAPRAPRGAIRAAARFFLRFAAAFRDRLSFFMRASTDTTREPLAAPLGAEVALRTPDLDLDATT